LKVVLIQEETALLWDTSEPASSKPMQQYDGIGNRLRMPIVIRGRLRFS
jgi:hypothetical protein